MNFFFFFIHLRTVSFLRNSNQSELVCVREFNIENLNTSDDTRDIFSIRLCQFPQTTTWTSSNRNSMKSSPFQRDRRYLRREEFAFKERNHRITRCPSQQVAEIGTGVVIEKILENTPLLGMLSTRYYETQTILHYYIRDSLIPTREQLLVNRSLHREELKKNLCN